MIAQAYTHQRRNVISKLIESYAIYATIQSLNGTNSVDAGQCAMLMDIYVWSNAFKVLRSTCKDWK